MTFLDLSWQIIRTWWRLQMETFSALLSICAGNSPVIGEFPAQRPVTLGFDVFFDMRLNNRPSKQSWSWWFETQSRPLWRHCNVPALKWQCWAWPMTMHEYSNSWFMCSLKLSKLFFVLWRLLEIKKCWTSHYDAVLFLWGFFVLFILENSISIFDLAWSLWLVSSFSRTARLLRCEFSGTDTHRLSISFPSFFYYVLFIISFYLVQLYFLR